MVLPLDTHALLWCLFDDSRLSANVRTHLADPRQAIFVSAASAWEITTKHRLGKLDEAGDVPERIEDYIVRTGFSELAVTAGHAARAGRMTIAHKDPFDRLLIAQAEIEDMTVVTTDREIRRHVATFW